MRVQKDLLSFSIRGKITRTTYNVGTNLQNTKMYLLYKLYQSKTFRTFSQEKIKIPTDFRMSSFSSIQ